MTVIILQLNCSSFKCICCNEQHVVDSIARNNQSIIVVPRFHQTLRYRAASNVKLAGPGKSIYSHDSDKASTLFIDIAN